MRFSPVILSGLAVLALVACSPDTPTLVRYDVTFKNLPADRLEDLPIAVNNVVGGRLGSLGITTADVMVQPTASGATVAITMPNSLIEPLTAQLTAPYTLRFMRVAGSGETVAISVAKFGNFAESGLNETHVEWMEASTDAEGMGAVTITFNEVGHGLLKSLAGTDGGRQYGLFAKGKLISLFTMNPNFGGDIVLNKIPSADLAAIFADDVVVGLHATFVRN